jgi:hypothetical protein
MPTLLERPFDAVCSLYSGVVDQCAAGRLAAPQGAATVFPRFVCFDLVAGCISCQGLHPRNTEEGKEANNSQVANTEQLDVSTFQRHPQFPDVFGRR